MFSKVSKMHQEVALACFEVVSASYWVSGKADHRVPSGQCMGPVGQFFENFRFLQKCPKRSQVVSKVSKIHQKVVLACFEFCLRVILGVGQGVILGVACLLCASYHR